MTASSSSSNPLTRLAAEFEALARDAQACRACPSMNGQLRILSHLNGPPDAAVMLVGEAPGRLGAARTAVPFAGDESGRRLDRLMAAAGWSRDAVFITNAVLCNPLDTAGRNRPPRASELSICRTWLQAQIELVNPRLVVALGAVALKSLSAIEEHDLTVRDSASPPIPWRDRHLAAVYHPSARAAIHRAFHRQLADFTRLSAWSRAPDQQDPGDRLTS